MLLLCVNIIVFAQNKTADSLENALNKHPENDTIRVNLLNEIALNVFTFDADKTLKYTQEAGKLADKLNYRKGKAESLRVAGFYYRVKSDSKKSIDCFEKALAIFENLGDKRSISICLNNLGSIHGSIGNYDISIEYFQKAIEIQEKLGDEQLLISPYINLGASYLSKGNYPKGLEFYMKSLKLSEKFKDSARMAHCYANLGSFNKETGNYPAALEYIEKSIAINKKLKIDFYLSDDYVNIATVYILMQDYDLALANLQKGLSIKQKLDNKAGIASCFTNIGSIYTLKNDFQSALNYYQKALTICKEIDDDISLVDCYKGIATIYYTQKKYQQAYNYSKLAYTLGQKIGHIEILKATAEIAAKSSAALGLYEEAYKYQVIFKSVSDKYLNEDNIKKTTGIEYAHKYEQEKQATQLEQQKKDALKNAELTQHKILSVSFIIGFLLMALIAIIAFRSYINNRNKKLLLTKQKLEIEEKNVTLLQLNSEITIQKNEIEKILDMLIEKNNLIEEQNIELQKTNVTKDKFFSIISHDLRGPLGNFNTLLELLTDKHRKYSYEELNKFLEALKESSQSTYNLLENLLTWARSQRGEILFEPNTNNLNELVHSIINLYAQSAQNKNISIIKQGDDNLIFSFDYNLVYTVIRNLVNNAIKFTNEKGKIYITTTKNAESIEINIKDTGLGIAPDVIDKLFRLDEKQHSTLGTKGEKGSGLGLILCKEFVEKHGGKIWCESEEGKGSEFKFTLPMKNERVID